MPYGIRHPISSIKTIKAARGNRKEAKKVLAVALVSNGLSLARRNNPNHSAIDDVSTEQVECERSK